MILLDLQGEGAELGTINPFVIAASPLCEAPLHKSGGELKFFKIKWGMGRKGGRRGIFEIFIGGKLHEMKLQTEIKISE